MSIDWDDWCVEGNARWLFAIRRDECPSHWVSYQQINHGYLLDNTFFLIHRTCQKRTCPYHKDYPMNESLWRINMRCKHLAFVFSSRRREQSTVNLELWLRPCGCCANGATIFNVYYTVRRKCRSRLARQKWDWPSDPLKYFHKLFISSMWTPLLLVTSISYRSSMLRGTRLFQRNGRFLPSIEKAGERCCWRPWGDSSSILLFLSWKSHKYSPDRRLFNWKWRKAKEAHFIPRWQADKGKCYQFKIFWIFPWL